MTFRNKVEVKKLKVYINIEKKLAINEADV